MTKIGRGLITALAVIALLCAVESAQAQRHGRNGNQTFTFNQNYSYGPNNNGRDLGYANLGLTAFLALLDSGTGVRQNGVPAPGYDTYPGGGVGGAWAGGVVVGGAPVVVTGVGPVVVCDNPSWCTWPSPLGPGPGSNGFAAGVRAGQQIARERRIAGSVAYHQNYAAGLELGAAGGAYAP